MNKVYFLLLILFLLMPVKTFAYYDVLDSRCTTRLKMSFREEADEVTYRLSKNDGDTVTYNLLLYNLSDNLVVKDGDGNTIKGNKIEKIEPGTRLSLVFYVSNKNYCEDYKASTKIINVPYYNKFYKSDICVGNESYYLCQKNSNIKMSEEEFNKKMNEYIDSIKNEEIESKIEIETEADKLIEFLNDYWIYLISFLLIIFTIIILMFVKSRKKNDDIL